MKISWKDRVTNPDVLKRVGEKELILYKRMVQQKLAFAGHVMRGSSGQNALKILEGKIQGTVGNGRPRRQWIDDIKEWTKLSDYHGIKRMAEDRNRWRVIACQPSFFTRRRHVMMMNPPFRMAKVLELLLENKNSCINISQPCFTVQQKVVDMGESPDVHIYTDNKPCSLRSTKNAKYLVENKYG